MMNTNASDCGDNLCPHCACDPCKCDYANGAPDDSYLDAQADAAQEACTDAPDEPLPYDGGGWPGMARALMTLPTLWPTVTRDAVMVPVTSF